MFIKKINVINLNIEDNLLKPQYIISRLNQLNI